MWHSIEGDVRYLRYGGDDGAPAGCGMGVGAAGVDPMEALRYE